jgi:hypothetical protein
MISASRMMPINPTLLSPIQRYPITSANKVRPRIVPSLLPPHLLLNVILIVGAI